MPLPANWSQIPVSGTYLDLNGDPASGYVLFESTQIVVDGSDVIMPTTIQFPLDSTGSFSGTLPATDDPDITPTGWQYKVTEKITNGRAPFYIDVPYNSTGIDMASVSAATPVAPASVPPATSPLTGAETFVGTQSSKSVEVTADQILANGTKTIATLTDALAFTPDHVGQVVYLKGRNTYLDGYEGKFVAVAGSAATQAQVTGDPTHAIFIPVANDATGATWILQREVRSKYDAGWWGFMESAAAAANATALQAANDYCAALNSNLIDVTQVGTAQMNAPKAIIEAPECSGGTFNCNAVTFSPGVQFDGKFKRYLSGDTGSLFTCQGLTSGGYYSGQGWSVVNCILDGNGAATKGLHCYLSNWSNFENILAVNFNGPGVQLTETQYCGFRNVRSYSNKIGFYLTARSLATDLPSLDNTFENCVASYNTYYGVWNQCASNNNWNKIDCSRNGVADIVNGQQLDGYIRCSDGYTVTAGGSGYAASSNIPVTITDAGAAVPARAYAVTNSSGVVTAVYGLESGLGITSPTITVGGSGTGATVTATISSDNGLGDFDGVSSTYRAGNDFSGFKAEHNTDDRPESGYSVVVYGGNITGTFQSPRWMRQISGTGPTSYWRYALLAATTTACLFTDVSVGSEGLLTAPGYGTDYSLFQSKYFGGLVIFWSNPAISSYQDLALLCVDETNAVIYNGKCSQVALDSGALIAHQFHVAPETTADYILQSRLSSDAYDRFSVLGDGTLEWGNGAGTPTRTLGYVSGNLVAGLPSGNGFIAPAQHGTTANRPATPVNYQSYFDTTLGYMIWYNGTNWVNATGATV